MKNTIVLITGIALIYLGILSIIRRNANFANIGLILIGFFMVSYFVWKNEIVGRLINLRSKNWDERINVKKAIFINMCRYLLLKWNQKMSL